MFRHWATKGSPVNQRLLTFSIYLLMKNIINDFLIGVAQPKGDWKADELATVGELLLDISIQLART